LLAYNTFDYDDGGSVSLRNVGVSLPVYIAAIPEDSTPRLWRYVNIESCAVVISPFQHGGEKNICRNRISDGDILKGTS
jgi:hypothetical protein